METCLILGYSVIACYIVANVTNIQVKIIAALVTYQQFDPESRFKTVSVALRLDVLTLRCHITIASL